MEVTQRLPSPSTRCRVDGAAQLPVPFSGRRKGFRDVFHRKCHLDAIPSCSVGSSVVAGTSDVLPCFSLRLGSPGYSDSSCAALAIRQLSCYNIKVRAVSDLKDVLRLLKLLTIINTTCSIENVNPGKTLPNIEKQLCEHHSCLPPRLLSSRVSKMRRHNVRLAVTSVPVLSALALRATCPASEVAPLLNLALKEIVVVLRPYK